MFSGCPPPPCGLLYNPPRLPVCRFRLPETRRRFEHTNHQAKNHVEKKVQQNSPAGARMARQHFAGRRLRIADAGHVSGAAGALAPCGWTGRQRGGRRVGYRRLRFYPGAAAAAAGHRFRPLRPQKSDLSRAGGVCAGQFPVGDGRQRYPADYRPRGAGRGGGERRGYRCWRI